MDSHQRRHSHASADGDREIVLCHACSSEWYRDERGLICPDCHSEITEIIDPENDPRQPSSTSTSPEPTPRRRQPYGDNDSDPDEGDIEEHLAGDHGFIYNRTTRIGLDRPHHDAALEPTFNRFIDMIRSFSPPPADVTPNGRQAPRFGADDTHQRHAEHMHGPEMPHFHRTTLRTNHPGGGTSITIWSGSMSTRPPGRTPPSLTDNRSDPFQDLFANVMRDLGPPHDEQQGAPPPFLRGLQELIGFLNPAHAVAGDAVYSQEALDRIISNLMETNPQSNAAPPASEDALNKLERRPVDKSMLEDEDKVECPICIDDMKEGDTCVFLPCKHFFHEDCVVLWLKEHNTCPICRTAIEKNPPPRNPQNQNGQASGDHQPTRFAASDISPASGFLWAGLPPVMPFASENDQAEQPEHLRHYDDPFSAAAAAPSRHRDAAYDSPGFGFRELTTSPSGLQARSSRAFGLGPTRPPVSRPPSHGQSRLNEVLRNVSARQRDRDEASLAGYDTSRLQRRNSLSPTSPRMGSLGEQGSRVRQRSPSQSSGRWAASDREAQRPSAGGGALNWLRNRFGGGGSGGSGGSGDSSSGSSRDDRSRR